MKKIITLVVILALLLVAAPWGIGRIAEKRVNSGLDQLVREAPYLKIVERKWTSGWFRSEQEVTFELFGDLTRALVAASEAAAKEAASPPGEAAEPIVAVEAAPEATSDPKAAPESGESAKGTDEPPADAPAEAPPTLRFTVRNEVLHGPVLWPAGVGLVRVNSKLVWSDEIRAKITEIFGTDEPVRISSVVGFFGGGSTSFSGEGRILKYKDAPGALTYDDFKVKIGYAKNFDKIDMDGSMPKIEATKDGEHFLLKGMSLKGKSKRVLGELYDSEFTFVIDELNIVDKQKAETGVSNIHYVVNSTLDDDYMDIGAKLGSGKVTSAALKELQLELNEVHYDFTLRRLHAATLNDLVTSLKESYTTPVTSAAVLDSVLTKPLKEHGIALLKHDPELGIDRIGIVTPDGDGVIKGVVRLKGVTEQDFAEGGNPMALVGKIDADITIEVAQKLIEKMPNGASGAGVAIDQGYAKREGDKLVSRIEFKHGELKINGKAQGLPGMGPPPGGAPPEAGARE